MLTSIIVTLNQQCQSKNVRDSLGISKALKVSSVLYNKTRRNIPTMSCCITQCSVWLSHLFLLLDRGNAYFYSLTLLSFHPGLQNKLPWGNSIAQLVTRVIDELIPRSWVLFSSNIDICQANCCLAATFWWPRPISFCKMNVFSVYNLMFS